MQPASTTRPVSRSEAQPPLGLAAGRAASAPAEASAPTDATRHICAGIYEDRLFGARVSQRLLEDPHHAVGPAPGVDLDAVARHCIAARRFAAREDILVAVALVVGIALLATGIPIVVAALPVFLVSFYRTSTSRFGALARSLRPGHFVADPLQGRCSVDEQRALARVAEAQRGNAIVYSGFSPFVGAGIELHGWSFTIDLTKGKEDAGGDRLEPRPIDIVELYAHVDEAVRRDGVDGLEIADYAFVNGRDIRDDPRFLRDPYEPPAASIPGDDLQALMGTPTRTARHYKCVRIIDWGGELVLSAYFRFARSGSSLFVEGTFWLLTPVKEAYRDIDNRAEHPTLRQAMQLVVAAAIATPFLSVIAPVSLGRRVIGPWWRWRKERQERKVIREQPLYDYGSSESVRELAASGQYRRYFQRLDKEMFFKLTQRAVLDALAEYLDEHDIDTGDLFERRTTIFNSGVIVSGGNVQADTMTVGHGARSIRERLGQAAKGPAPRTVQ